MWPKTKITELLQIEYPIILAGMAGGISTPALVAAVSNAGGLGTLGAGYLSPDQIRKEVTEIRSLTDRPFAVNLFIPESHPTAAAVADVDTINAVLQPYRGELGISSLPDIIRPAQNFFDQLEVVMEMKVPVFSFTFGAPEHGLIRDLQKQGTKVMGTATTVREAVLLEEHGVDSIVGQGYEAGGHRGTFLGSFEQSCIGTIALIPQIADHVAVPIVAAGGIMDGRSITAAFALGASGVQLGTAFLACDESGAHKKYKEVILKSTDEETVVTRAFSGKPARGIRNRFISEMEQHSGKLLPYPIQNAMTKDLRQAAARQNCPDFMSLWAGQGSRLSIQKSAEELMNDLVNQVEQVITRLT